MLDIKTLTLEDTIPLMKSECFKDRLRAEYYQTAIRWDKLWETIEQYETGTISYIPRTSIDDCRTQADIMREYLDILLSRARLEGADLDLPLNYLYDDEEGDFDE